MAKLNLKKIESYNLPKAVYNPDWDDSGYEFTLPSGITLSGLYRCNNAPCKMSILEGLDGLICIETEEELKELIGLSYEETMTKIKAAHPDFDEDDY